MYLPTLTKNPAILAAITLSLTTLAAADTIDDVVRRDLAAQHVPGAWVMVLRNGKVIKRAGYGIANLEDSAPVTAHTLMQTGSIGKMFTATGIMLLAKDGKVKLSDSIAKYFERAPDWWKPITIRHLLSHTGGVPEYEGDKYSLDLKREYTDEELIEHVRNMKPDFAPGERWSYSNTDYMLLGLIIKKLTGRFYADVLRQHVWGPAKMPTIRSLNDREVIPHRSAGYDWSAGHWTNQEYVSASLNQTADGTLYATPDDFIAWDRALDHHAVLPVNLQEEMWTPVKLNDGSLTKYGYGWAVGDRFGHRVVAHSGAWQGFLSAYVRYRDDDLSIAVFCNCTSADPQKITSDIAGVIDPQLSVATRKAISDPDRTSEDVAKIVSYLSQGKQPTWKVTGNLVSMPAEALIGSKMAAQGSGPVVKVELVYRNLSQYIYRVKFKSSVRGMAFLRNKEGHYSLAN